MSGLKIDSDVPIPPARASSVAGKMRLMKVGDSVLFDSTHATAAARGIAVFGKGNYTTRKENGGIRLWRTK